MTSWAVFMRRVDEVRFTTPRQEPSTEYGMSSDVRSVRVGVDVLSKSYVLITGGEFESSVNWE